MKPVKLTEQQREDILSIINNLELAVLANDLGKYDLVPTALEDVFIKFYDLLIETCIDGEK